MRNEIKKNDSRVIRGVRLFNREGYAVSVCRDVIIVHAHDASNNMRFTNPSAFIAAAEKFSQPKAKRDSTGLGLVTMLLIKHRERMQTIEICLREITANQD